MELHRKTFEKGFASIGYMEIVWRQISASISSIHGFRGYGVSKLAELSGHIKAIYRIALPSGSEKPYTASECHSGHYDGVVNLGREIGSLINADPWLLAGIKIVVKAWNIQSCADLSLDRPVGQIRAMVVDNDMLFAGA
ncbi:hypothetical protein AAG906_000693 [Vitis piasezkii]